MAWKWYEVRSYKASLGSVPNYYGTIQLIGTNFYASLKMQKDGVKPPATAPVVGTQQRFYASMDFQQMAGMVDILRNEKPVQFGWLEAANPTEFHLMSGEEPVGEGDGTTA